MAQPQYYEVLKQEDNPGQQFFTNVEDQTVQYVITPNKTQVQFPTTPIVVASGDQLMVVNGPPQQIVIDQTSISYQEPEIQQQMQQPRQQQMKPTIRVQNQSPTIRQMSPSPAQQRPTLPPPLQSINSQPQQPRPMNFNQIHRTPIQLNLRQQLPLTTRAASVQSILNTMKPINSPQAQLRQSGPNQLMRQPVAGQQIRVSTPTGQQRPTLQIRTNAMVNARFQATQMQQQQMQVSSSQAMDEEDTNINISEEQEAVSLADGTVVSVAVYKRMLGEQKGRTVTQKSPTTQQTTPSPQGTPINQTPATKKRNTTPRNPRQPPRGGARSYAAQRFPTISLDESAAEQTASLPESAAKYSAESDGAAAARPLQQPQQIPQQQQMQQQVQQQLQQIQQQQMQQYVRPSQANYVIQPPRANQNPPPQRPLPAYIPSSQIQKIIESTPISEEFSDSIRMLVLLENGEQRLITFTLPKEACTIQEILEQVNVPFQSNTNIQVTEANSNGINYIVTVGNVPPLGNEEEESQSQPQEDPKPVPPIQPLPQPLPQQPQPQQLAAPCPPTVPQPSVEPPKPSSPERGKDLPKLVPGMLALCGACGYLSEDFAKCIRCQRKLPDNVKAIPAIVKAANGQKTHTHVGQQIQQLHSLQQQNPQTQPNQQQPQNAIQSPVQQPLQVQLPSPVQQPSQVQQQGQQPHSSKNGPVQAKSASPTKKRSAKNKSVEQESVVISSDEEEDETPAGLAENILQKLGNSVTISPVTKEPSTNDLQRHISLKTNLEQGEIKMVKTKLKCRTVRIGSYRCVPTEEIVIDSLQVTMKVPHPKDKDIRTVTIDKCDMVKVLASFNSSLPVIFYYLNLSAAEKIRKELDMTADSDYYFDPISMEDEAQRRVTLLPDDIEENDRNLFQLIYASSSNILDELNVKEANDILIKTCPKELAKNAIGFGTFTEIKQLFTYPPEGRGRISINTEDFLCLGQDQFLNDVIIDFYLKYVVDNLPSEQKRKVHIFSTFFYKRLTTKPVKAHRKSQPAELNPTLTSAQKRHARVKTWTKNVNLFEKDFVVVPINENAHWFLAIICFPGLDGSQTWDGKPYKIEVKSRPKKKVSVGTIGTVSVMAVKQEKITKPIVCEDPELSDKDEAEGDDSELESDDSEELPLSQSVLPPPVIIPAVVAPRTPKEPRPAIQQPCILIFDSLAGANRSRVVATLRDYLTCEYKAKLGKERIYDKNIIKGANPKVPQQNNFTDCGLYVLQYVEQFFKDPIKDYHIPIKEIKNWFEEITVTKKREDLAILIKSLMREYGKDIRLLPDIAFPTINGKLVELEPDEEEEEEDEMMEGEQSFGEEDMRDDSFTTLDTTKSELSMLNAEEPTSPLKPSNESTSEDFVTQTVMNPKPDISEFPRHTNKDTLSILKAKRIVKHKHMDGPDVKKHKSDQQ
ncbi:hypothetical protein JTB14_009289 [Gonioctena quinquepunctata]|nr:hypothetical protein JTB14_009289 [Gonioctena quinquepunctata]